MGKNMMLIEYLAPNKEMGPILIVDMGLRFPEEDMPGIDFIIPNTSYLKGRERDIVGMALTHGHYDHIGAIPYIIDKLWNPLILAGGLTKGIVIKRQDDFPNQPKLNIQEVKDGDIVKLPPFEVEFFRQNHNITDNFGLFIKTPVGNLIHTSDFKFDPSPVNEPPTDFEKLRRIGEKGILLLMSDSTRAEDEGRSISENTIMENLDLIFQQAPGRIVAATFSSLINRIQQVITLSEKYGRKVAVDGYSMKTNVEICKRLGYIKTKRGTIILPKDIDNYPANKVTIVCTGAQGEGQAVLMRMANKEHRFVRLRKGDTVIFSSSVVPGNERTVQILKDELYRQGTIVFHYKMMDIHAGGHAQKEELKEIIKIMKPKFFLPIHGQYSMLVNHAKIAEESGIQEKNIAVAETGQVVVASQKEIFISKETAPSNYIMVDGLGIGDVGEIVLRDRQNLSKDGMFVIVALVDKKTGRIRSSPDIISRGFVYLRESRQLLAETRKRVIIIVERATGSGGAVNWSYVKDNIRNKIGEFLYQRTKRRPMILPVVIEV